MPIPGRCAHPFRAAALALALLVAACQGAGATPRPYYTIEDLGTLGGSSLAYGINSAGHVVGVSWLSPRVGDRDQGASHAFRWTPAEGMRDLGTLGGAGSGAKGINDMGQIVGSAHTTGDILRAFLWTDADGMLDLGTLGGHFSEASAINRAGQVVGTSGTPNRGTRAFQWMLATGMLDLGTLGGIDSGAYGINNAGQITGWSAIPNPRLPPYWSHRPFLWTATDGFLDLGTFGGPSNIAQDINDASEIAGYSTTAGNGSGNGSFYRAFRWSTTKGMRDLGTLPGMDNSWAYSLNDVGQVVGECQSRLQGHRAFLYTDAEGMIDLNRRILSSLGWHLEAATDINSSGQIVGHGSRFGQRRAFRLTPDGLPPVTQASSAPMPEGTGHGLLVFLNASDNLGGTGIEEITYSATGAHPLASTTVGLPGLAIPITSPGRTTLTFSARDRVGNQETTRTLTIQVDERSGSPSPGGSGAGPIRTQAYTVQDLGTLGGTLSEAYDLNNAGQVVGRSMTLGDREWNAFIYDRQGGMRPLGIPNVGGSSANAINRWGQVVGEALVAGATATNAHAFLLNGGVLHDLGYFGGVGSLARAINDVGQIVGHSWANGQYAHAFLLPGGILDLSSLGAAHVGPTDINANGQVVGFSFFGGNYWDNAQAFLLEGSQPRPLGTLGGKVSLAFALNDLGQVVGMSTVITNSGQEQERAFLYDGAQMHNLGTLGGALSFASDINRWGQVVGYSSVRRNDDFRAFIYSDGVLRDLNKMIPANSGWVLTIAEAINDAGQIAGYGLIDEEQHAFLLTPVPTEAPTPPRAPSALSVTAPAGASPSQLDLAWTDASDNETGFEIQRKTSSTDWALIATTPSDRTVYADTGLEPFTRYRYRVRSVNSAEVSLWSNEAAGETGTGALLDVSPTGLEFDKVAVGTSSGPRTVTLTNRGTGPLTIHRVAFTGSGRHEFSLGTSVIPRLLLPGQSRDLRVLFTPSATGSWLAALTIDSDAPDSPLTVALSGAGGGPMLKIGVAGLILPDRVDFGSHTLGASGVLRSVTLTNTGAAPLKIQRISLSGTTTRDFTLVSGAGAGVLRPNASRTLTVRYTPKTLGDHQAVLTIRSNAEGSPHALLLEGAGALDAGGAVGADGAPRPSGVMLIAVADGVPARSGKITVAPGQCVTFRLRLKYRNGAVAELSEDGEFTLDAGGGRGRFQAPHVWCPRAEDAGRAVILLGRYTLPSGKPLASKLAVTVRRSAP